MLSDKGYLHCGSVSIKKAGSGSPKLGFWISDLKIGVGGRQQRNDCRAPTDPLSKSENIPFKKQKSAIPDPKYLTLKP
jgi:hypothetical protein